MAARKLPAWADYGLLPLLNLTLAFLVSGLVVVILGESPLQAVETLVYGAFGYGEAVGYTLYYATNLIFTGLAVALAFHAGLFNIGGEGQAYLGGLGLGLVGIYLGWLPGILSIPLAVLAAALFGGIWGLIPGWLQARRGSHVVITTIMLNFVAAALMTYLMVNVLIKPGQSAPESVTFAETVWMPSLKGLFGLLRRRFRLRAGQPLAAPGAALLRRHVAVRLAQPDRLRAARGRPERGRRGLWRHLARAPHHPGDDALGRPGRAHGHQRDPGRRSTASSWASPAATASPASPWR